MNDHTAFFEEEKRMNKMDKHLKETLMIWVVCILSFLMATGWFYQKVDLFDKTQKVSQMTMIENDDRGVVLGEEATLELADKLDKVKMVKQTFALKEKPSKYRVEYIIQETEKEKKILFLSEEEIQIGHILYKVESGKIPLDYFANFFN